MAPLFSSGLLSQVWKWIDRFTLPGFLVFLTSWGICFILWLQLDIPWVGPGSYLELSNETLNRSVCLAALLVGSLFVLVVRSAAAFRVTVAFKVVFLELLVITTKSLGLEETSLLAILLVEICLYEGFIVNLVAGFLLLSATHLVGALAALMAHNPDQPVSAAQLAAALVPGQVPAFLLLSLVIVTTALMVYYRERNVVQDHRIRQLDSVIERLSATNLGYQTYAHEAAAKSQVEERLRISRELHDIVGYTFTNNIMMMEAAITKIHKEPDRVRVLIDLARDNAKTGYEKIREALYILRSNEMKKTPSIERIRKMMRVFQVATQIDVRVNFTNFPTDLEDEVESFFYHFVQESLTNAFLHGAATRIDVSLFQTPRGLSASVSDNGVGGASFHEGIGIRGMRERLAPLNGTLEIRNLGRGFELLVDVPLA